MPSFKRLWLCALLPLSGCALPPEQLALRQRLEAGVQTPEDMVRFKTPDAAYLQLSASAPEWPQTGLPARSMVAGSMATAAAADPANQLLQAAQQGQANTVRSLLRAGASPEGRDGAMTPMAAAALGGHTDVVKLLLASGAKTDTSNEAGESALMRAVRMNHLATAAVLLDAGASLQAHNRQGDGLCMVAIAENFPDMLQLLLQRGANPNTPDRDGLTPLYWAEYLQRDALVPLLLAAGADPQVKKRSLPDSASYAMGAF